QDNVATNSQQTIDTGLSLAPATSSESTPSAAPTQPRAQTKPAPTYAGCKLALAFVITDGSPAKAGPMHYTLMSKNLGSASCESASISVYYANDERFVSATPRATSNGYYWNLGTLSPGASDSITLATERSAPLLSGDVANEACLSANNGTD